MNDNKQFEQDGFIFELESNKSDNVTILNHTGVWGHCTTYFNNTPVITNEKVICIPGSIVDSIGHKFVVFSVAI